MKAEPGLDLGLSDGDDGDDPGNEPSGERTEQKIHHLSKAAGPTKGNIVGAYRNRQV
ncbi:hypothetical protein MBUL_00491 [Methylobacterium bullatum]|uniref:Uncharacterized protein n=1 Tax=Methylobacterium bullatum TaxID=570505 RepID=A0A679IN49_9HYPH|nr:hypothetical protein MBUL_00491 [Methylobacterium bullatum]